MQKLLIIGFVWPEPTTTAAGGRMTQLIHYFLEEDYNITFACAAATSNYAANLKELGVSVAEIELNSDSFDVFVSNLQPTHILFDRFLTEEQFGWRVAEQAPNAIRILDTEDLHFLRKAREESHKKGTEVTNSDLLNSNAAKREIASIYRCDLSLIISDYEMELLQSVFKVDKNLLLHLPFMLDEIGEEQPNEWTPFEERNNFVCIGNGKHAPNVDAIKWLKTEIWSGIKKQLPKAELHIYGAYFSQQISDLHNVKDGFLIKGWAEDINKVLSKTRINLAPLRFGAGIKGKLVAAMQNGTPSITTKIGAEGMHQNLPWAGVVANDVEDIVEASVSLYQKETAWKVAQNNGISIINSIYSKTKLSNTFALVLEVIKKDLASHRNKNFIGKMLMHHSLNSTKYLSKYIQEKNK